MDIQDFRDFINSHPLTLAIFIIMVCIALYLWQRKLRYDKAEREEIAREEREYLRRQVNARNRLEDKARAEDDRRIKLAQEKAIADRRPTRYIVDNSALGKSRTPFHVWEQTGLRGKVFLRGYGSLARAEEGMAAFNKEAPEGPYEGPEMGARYQKKLPVQSSL